jgi:hypothetical protein
MIDLGKISEALFEEGSDLVFCHRCKHYYVTWDKNFPYGCKAMRFKSKSPPYLTVRNTSGKECLLFARKKPYNR